MHTKWTLLLDTQNKAPAKNNRGFAFKKLI